MSFFGSLFGSDQRKTTKQANATAIKSIKGGYSKARGILEPLAEQGIADDTFYRNLLGLNGNNERDTAQGVITSDPLWSGKLAQDQNAMLRHMNARGASGAGRTMLAGQRVLTENYGNWMDKYRQRATEGQQHATNLSNLDYGYGATRAGQAVQQGNAMVQAQNSGVNNVLGLLGAGINAYSAYKKAPGR